MRRDRLSLHAAWLTYPLTVLLLLALTACGGPETTPEPSSEAPTDTLTAAPEAVPPAPAPATLIDVLRADGRFTTLVAALGETGLAQALQGTGPFTLFAPTDEAFAALPDGLIEGLSGDELTNILVYHVCNGLITAADVAAAETIPTAHGTALNVTVGDDGTMLLNDATVVTADVEAANGIIHVIDAVLIPPPDSEL